MSMDEWKNAEQYYCTSDMLLAIKLSDESWRVGRYDIKSDCWREYVVSKENFEKHYVKVQS